MLESWKCGFNYLSSHLKRNTSFGIFELSKLHNMNNVYRDPRITRQYANKAIISFLPFFHGFGLCMYFCAIYSGQKLVVLSKFEEELFLNSIETYRITLVYLVPPLMLFLAKSPLVERYDLSSLRELLFGSAPCSKATIDLVQKRLYFIYHLLYQCFVYCWNSYNRKKIYILATSRFIMYVLVILIMKAVSLRLIFEKFEI